MDDVIKIKKKHIFIGVIFSVILLLSLVSVYAYSYKYAFMLEGGGSTSSTKTKSTSAYDNCDPVDVAKKCCDVVDSRDQCKNHCNQRASACGWSNSEKGTCTTDVTSQCDLA